MRKYTIPFSLLMIFVIVFTIGGCTTNKQAYSSNVEIKNFYKKNENAFNEFIESFDENNNIQPDDYSIYFNKDVIIDQDLLSRRFYVVSEALSKIGVTEIEYYNNCLHFTFNSIGDYYNAIYYSFDNEPCEDCPIFVNDFDNKHPFRNIGNGIFVNGEKNTGEDWYKTENIEGKWYYWETHLA